MEKQSFKNSESLKTLQSQLTEETVKVNSIFTVSRDSQALYGSFFKKNYLDKI